jgi:hypothetical protein
MRRQVRKPLLERLTEEADALEKKLQRLQPIVETQQNDIVAMEEEVRGK